MNDLTNRELIRRKYTFRYPELDKLRNPHANYDDEMEDQFLGSMVMDGSDVKDLIHQNEQ